MKIGVILDRVNPVIGEAIEILRTRGADVELIQPRLMNFALSELLFCHAFASSNRSRCQWPLA